MLVSACRVFVCSVVRVVLASMSVSACCVFVCSVVRVVLALHVGQCLPCLCVLCCEGSFTPSCRSVLAVSLCVVL